MFEIMEVSKQVYKVEAHYKIFNRAYTNRAGRIKNKKGVEATSTSNPENFRSGKLKNRDAGNRIMTQPEIKHAWCMAPYTPRRSVKS